MSASTVPRLVLWDIDKTLVDIGSISHEIYAAAFQAVTGQALTNMPDMAGRTDRDLITATLQLHDIPEPERSLDDFYEALALAANARAGEIKESGRCLPGARDAIDRLAASGVVQSVVTGNIRQIAEIKLSVFGLAEHVDFDIGGYGSDDGNREALVRLARQRAAAKHGEPSTRHVVVIGDTPYDIAGAKANGVVAIGVASGETTMSELQAAGADAVLASLEDTDRLTHLILGEAH